MSNHDQTQENLAAYLAGGLTPRERAEVEQHLAACGDCAQALNDARKLEQAMDDLFADARPDAELEDRALAGVRKSRIRRASILRFVSAAAAVLVVGLVGAVVQAIAFADFTGKERRTVSDNRLVLFDGSVSMHDVSAEPMSLPEDRLLPEEYSPRKPHFQIVDVDPAMIEGDKDIQYKAERMDEVSVPGLQGRANGALLGANTGLGRESPKNQSSQGVEFGPMGFYPVDKSFAGRSGATRDNAIRSGGGGASEAEAKFALMLKAPQNAAQWGVQPPPEKTDTTFTTVGSKIGSAAGAIADNRKPDDGRGYFKGAVAQGPKPGDGPPSPPADPRGGGDQAPDGSKPASNKPAQDVREEIAALLPPKAEKPKPPEPTAPESKIIYTGEMEFEIDSFDAGIKKVKELVDAVNRTVKKGPGAVRPEIDRTKQPNGKTRGYIVVRIPPELLDKFIDDLRAELSKFGELKSQHLGSQNVTKQYTDTKSELDAARLVEKRLIEIIEKKQGDIKDLVAAENVLGTWRSKIEKMEGEIRYYNNQVALSTLTITLVERDIGTPASLVVSEKVQMRIEVDEVKKALESAVDAVRKNKGRVLKSELKQHKAGQFEAILHAEVPPAQKDEFAKKLGELGVVSENEATQKTVAEGGSGKPGKIEPRVNDVVFEVKLNNIVNIQPRHAVSIDLATAKVPDAYKELKDKLAAIAKAQIRVDQLNEQDKLRITAQLEFNVPKENKGAIDKLIGELGKVLKQTSTQAAITEIATEQKFGYTLSLLGPASIAPRETVTLKVEVKNVDQRIDELKKAVQAGNGRVADSNVIRQENGQVSAVVLVDVPLAVQKLIVLKVKESGNLLHEQSVRNPNIPESELASARIEVTLTGVFAGKPPRETVNLVFEVNEVAKTAVELKELVKAVQGRVADGKVEQKPNGQVTTELEFDVPLAVHETLVKQFKDNRKELSYKTATNASVPDNELATARIKVFLTTPRPIGPSDSGMGSFARRSLDWSFTIFSYCILAIIAGLSAIVPVGIAIYIGYKAIWWMWPSANSKPLAAVAKPANGGAKPTANP